MKAELKCWMGCPILSVGGNPKPEWLLIKMWIEFAFPPPSSGVQSLIGNLRNGSVRPSGNTSSPFRLLTCHEILLPPVILLTCSPLMWFSKVDQESSLCEAYFVNVTNGDNNYSFTLMRTLKKAIVLRYSIFLFNPECILPKLQFCMKMWGTYMVLERKLHLCWSSSICISVRCQNTATYSSNPLNTSQYIGGYTSEKNYAILLS